MHGSFVSDEVKSMSTLTRHEMVLLRRKKQLLRNFEIRLMYLMVTFIVEMLKIPLKLLISFLM